MTDLAHRTQRLIATARLARLNTRRLLIQAQFLAERTRELQRAAHAACRNRKTGR